MILDVFISVGVMALKFVNWVLSVFNLPYVSNMTGAISWAVGMIYSLNTQFPVIDLFACMTVLLLVTWFRFQIRFAFETVFPLIPFIGRKISIPHVEGYDEPEQPYYQSIRRSGNYSKFNDPQRRTFYLYRRKRVR